jgi:hypothetical protein
LRACALAPPRPSPLTSPMPPLERPVALELDPHADPEFAFGNLGALARFLTCRETCVSVYWIHRTGSEQRAKSREPRERYCVASTGLSSDEEPAYRCTGPDLARRRRRGTLLAWREGLLWCTVLGEGETTWPEVAKEDADDRATEVVSSWCVVVSTDPSRGTGCCPSPRGPPLDGDVARPSPKWY